jgi:dTDP-4-amino-4,6-dideoxygalactose transaminase
VTSPAFSTVELFEERMALFSGSKYGVSVASCTDALFLCFKYRQVSEVTFPARTYISAVFSAIHAGAVVDFVDFEWSGAYRMGDIVDGAGRMSKQMYQGGLHCVSFHARKHLPIGRGGMILTDDLEAVKWFKKARFDGRNGEIPFKEDDVSMIGWNCYMTPEQAARGLQLLEGLKPNLPDMYTSDDYPDLRNMTVFKKKRLHVVA